MFGGLASHHYFEILKTIKKEHKCKSSLIVDPDKYVFVIKQYKLRKRSYGFAFRRKVHYRPKKSLRKHNGYIGRNVTWKCGKTVPLNIRKIIVPVSFIYKYKYADSNVKNGIIKHGGVLLIDISRKLMGYYDNIHDETVYRVVRTTLMKQIWKDFNLGALNFPRRSLFVNKLYFTKPENVVYNTTRCQSDL